MKRHTRATRLMAVLVAIGALLAGTSAARGGQDPAEVPDLGTRLDCAALGDAQYQRTVIDFEQLPQLERRAAASPVSALATLAQLYPGLDIGALKAASVTDDEAVYEVVVDNAVALAAQVKKSQGDAYVLVEYVLCPSFLSEVSS